MLCPARGIRLVLSRIQYDVVQMNSRHGSLEKVRVQLESRIGDDVKECKPGSQRSSQSAKDAKYGVHAQIIPHTRVSLGGIGFRPPLDPNG